MDALNRARNEALIRDRVVTCQFLIERAEAIPGERFEAALK